MKVAVIGAGNVGRTIIHDLQYVKSKTPESCRIPLSENVG